MTFPAQLISFYSSRRDSIPLEESGSTTDIVIPDGVTLASAVCIGGGGGGASGLGGGGGGGGLTWGTFSVQPGDVLSVRVASGGAAGNGGNGGDGGRTYIALKTRSGVSIPTPEIILEALGGGGGKIGVAGTSGLGNRFYNTSNVSVYLNGGGNGGTGGNATSGGAGGGGVGGYDGNGGNGGSVSPLSNATPAATNSGGGGGGGGSTSGVGFGGGGAGIYGYSGTGQGVAGVNDTSGGGGASNFVDPGDPTVPADFVGTSLTTGFTTCPYPPGMQPGNFLLFLSGTDSDSGITKLAVPTGFTTFAVSIGGSYYTESNNLTGIGTIPDNQLTQTFKTKDLNFASSYRYVPDDGLTGNIEGLDSNAIHNCIALKRIPNPAQIIWAADSGDPAINPGLTQDPTSPMPDPPSVSNVPAGAVGITVGFLANTLLNPNPTVAGANTIGIATVNGGNPPNGVAVMSSYLQATTVGNYDPNRFLTGTASHARAYSIEIPRSGASAVTVVGSAVTGTYVTGAGVTIAPSTITLPSGIQSGDLLLYVAASDSAKLNDATGGPTISSPTGITGKVLDSGKSDDVKGGGKLSFRLEYVVLDGGETQLTGLTNTNTGTGTPAIVAHMIIILRNGSLDPQPNNVNYVGWDNGYDTQPSGQDAGITTSGQYPAYSPPNPPTITTQSNNSMVLAIGMLDNVTISNVTSITSPTGYIGLASASYGVQNNGAIIMSAYKTGLGLVDTVEDPSPFSGAGANIWASQTIVIGGPGNETTGNDSFPGQYGGGGGSKASGTAMPGAQGGARIVFGATRRYPSTNLGNNVFISW